uniref:TSA: Wollemia nobilis Ref_Wollemi_Transcript_12730_1914 transcribed RNA sequence n=1 Tax=Wollemia nobilis TaxID=56998 RepID=A0A0C9RUB4_9CONI
MYQIFVKGLDGKTKCLQLSSPRLEIQNLKNRLSDLLKIPSELQRLVSGTCQISDEGFLVAGGDGFFPQLHVLLRLRAGKGGFGSLLRGAATKAGQKKTSNFDACRDMSGRRLRHVNAEKKLEEWKAEAQERHLETVAEEYLKKQMKQKRKVDPTSEEGVADVEKYRAEASRAMEEVESAVKDGLVEALRLRQNGKRKMAEEAVRTNAKRAKLWMLEEEDEEEEDEDIDEQMEDNEPGDCLMEGNEEFGSSSSSNSESASDSEMPSLLGKEKSESGSCDDRETSIGLEKEEPISSLGENGKGCDETEAGINKEVTDALNSILEQNVKFANAELKTEEANFSSGENDSSCAEKEASVELKKDMLVASHSTEVQHIINKNMDETETMFELEDKKSLIIPSEIATSEANSGSTSVITNACREIDSVCDSNNSIEEPLDFDKFNTAKDVEVLGLERLKNELQTRGLKCGGSLAERAARLFLLKMTPLEKFPKKHFAKAKDAGKWT